MAEYDYSSTQYNLPYYIADIVKGFASGIPDAHLDSKGREDEPHCTICYGLDPSVSASDVAALLSGTIPFDIQFGHTVVFSDHPERDVLTVSVSGSGLSDLHELISSSLPNTKTHPTHPFHATVAYLKKGLGAQYAGVDILPGSTCTVDYVVFSDTSGKQVKIMFNNEDKQACEGDRIASSPTQADVHVNAPMGNKKRKSPNPHFMRKMIELMTSRYSDDEIKNFRRKARAHAGGKAKMEAIMSESLFDEFEEAAEEFDEANEAAEFRSGKNAPGKGGAEFRSGKNSRGRGADEEDDEEDDQEYRSGKNSPGKGAAEFANKGDRLTGLPDDPPKTKKSGKKGAEAAEKKAPKVPKRDDKKVLHNEGEFDEEFEEAAEFTPHPISNVRPRPAKSSGGWTGGKYKKAEEKQFNPMPGTRPRGVDPRFKPPLAIWQGGKRQPYRGPGGSGPQSASEVSDMCANGGGWRLFVEHQMVEPPEWMPLLPKPGSYVHPKYKEISLSKARNRAFADGINSNVYQSSLPINTEHNPSNEGAYGWIEGARMNEDGSVDARVRWSDLGVDALRKDRFRFISPEWTDSWEDPTGRKHADVIRGAALTVRPFFKDAQLRPLVATEDGWYLADDEKRTFNEDTYVFSALTPSNPDKRENNSKRRTHMADDNDATQTAVEPAVDAAAFAELQERFAALEAEAIDSRKAAEERDDQIRKLSEVNARLADDAETMRFTEEVSGKTKSSTAHWVGDKDGHIRMLKSIKRQFGETSEQFKFYIETNRAIAAQLEAGDLLKEFGRGGGDDANSAWDKACAMANEKRTKNPSLTIEQARDLVFQENKGLYTQYLTEEGR